MTDEEIWICVICGERTNTCHEHTLEELLVAIRENPDGFCMPPERPE
jgi:heterodisulfide reductase subunit C